jgi:hypothetical protein
VSNAVEIAGQDVDQKAADELVRVECHQLVAVVGLGRMVPAVTEVWRPQSAHSNVQFLVSSCQALLPPVHSHRQLTGRWQVRPSNLTHSQKTP